MEELFGKGWENVDEAKFEEKRNLIENILKKTEIIMPEKLKGDSLKKVVLEYKDNITIDTENPESILDHLRKAVKWKY